MNDRQRLEAIIAVVGRYLPPDGISREEAMSQIIELVDPLPELAKPEQEPVAWMYKGNFHDFDPSEWASPEFAVTPLYTAPPRKPWVGLTDDEIEEAWGNTPMMLNARDGGSRKMFARAIEAKLKELNAAPTAQMGKEK
jgi:hypothetical protein